MVTEARGPARLLLPLVALLASACVTPFRAPVNPSPLVFFGGYSAPATTNFDATPIGSREGVATSYFVYDPLFTNWRFTWGDISTTRAARNAGIQTVHFADYEFNTIFGVFGWMTIRVHGD